MADTPRYRITEKIDAGGMAEVYRGMAQSAVGGIKKAVAIKRILPNLTKNKKFVSMFLDEARVSMHLQHANIVGVFDIGMADTAYFIVMEYVDGANLKTIIDSSVRQGLRIPLQHVLYIIMEVCKGLSYAHQASDPENGRELNVVHRDISPPNILISKRGEVKLVDFGLAKATSQLEDTDPGVVKGKFSYLSPEAASGLVVDARTDIFATGILLYELITGKRLFLGESDYQTVELVRQAKIPSVSAQNPQVKPQLEQIVMKALTRDPADRYQTAGDLQDAIAHYLFGERLKVTSRDIEHLVEQCLSEKRRTQPRIQQPVNLIDELINEEILKFTSLDNLDDPAALSPSPSEPYGNAPLDPGSFIDPRAWSEDIASRSARNVELQGKNPSGNRGAGAKPKRDGDITGLTGLTGLEDLLEGTGSKQFVEAEEKLRSKNRPHTPIPTGRVARPKVKSNAPLYITGAVLTLIAAVAALYIHFR